MSGIDGEPIRFEWNSFPGFTSIEILKKIQKDLEARQIKPGELGGIILFMSLFSDIDWTRKEILWTVFRIPKGERLCKKISARTLVILRSGKEEKWYGSYSYKPEGTCDNEANQMN